MFWIASGQAQAQGGGWSEPYRLSSDAGSASEGYAVADQYGYVHVFWSETLSVDQRPIIQYARFDGETWSTPTNIYVGRPLVSVENVSPVVDQHGTLHIAWAEGLVQDGPAYYTYAPANNALSAQNWAPPLRIDIPSKSLRLRVDSRGVFHLLYTNVTGETGVYYIHSEDQGITWSDPVWLDPDILPNHVPDDLNFELDEQDGLHAVWFYSVLNPLYRPDWVRYAHSLDGGKTWSLPFLIDHYVEDGEHGLEFAGPIMTVQGQTVHVIWAAGPLPYRYHRFSTDAGQTWSAPKQIFGDLHGQAFDGFAVDGAGRVHFVGQIRFPRGIYHAYWDQTQWTSPSLIYLITLDEKEIAEGYDFGDVIHAHNTNPVVRAGNQLVLTFADQPGIPNRRLFVMQRTLDDIPPLESVPTPVPSATPVREPSPTPRQPTPLPTLTATEPLFDTAGAQPPGQVPSLNLSLSVALIPTLLLLGGTVVIRWLKSHR
jgi:hypothetical protein